MKLSFDVSDLKQKNKVLQITFIGSKYENAINTLILSIKKLIYSFRLQLLKSIHILSQIMRLQRALPVVVRTIYIVPIFVVARKGCIVGMLLIPP